MLKHKNKVYRWIGTFYLIPEGSGDVYIVKGVKKKLEYLPEMSTSTIRYYGDLVGVNFTFK